MVSMPSASIGGTTRPLGNKRPASTSMKLKSSAKDSSEDCVMGLRGCRIFCCMVRA